MFNAPMNGQPSPASMPKQRLRWSIIAIIFVGAVVGGIIIGMWKSAVSYPTALPGTTRSSFPPPPAPPAPPPLSGVEDEKSTMLAQYGSSTEVGDIDKDLQGTDLSGLDGEMAAIGQEVQ